MSLTHEPTIPVAPTQVIPGRGDRLPDLSGSTPAGGQISTRDYFPGARGFTELKAGKLAPASLYEAQLCERLGF